MKLTNYSEIHIRDTKLINNILFSESDGKGGAIYALSESKP